MEKCVGSNPTEGKICFSHFTLFRMECEELFFKTNIKLLNYIENYLCQNVWRQSIEICKVYNLNYYHVLNNIVYLIKIVNFPVFYLFFNFSCMYFRVLKYSIHDTQSFRVPNSNVYLDNFNINEKLIENLSNLFNDFVSSKNNLL